MNAEDNKGALVSYLWRRMRHQSTQCPRWETKEAVWKSTFLKIA